LSAFDDGKEFGHKTADTSQSLKVKRSTVTVTEALALRPLLEDRGRVPESISQR